VAVWYNGPLYVLQLTVSQFGTGDTLYTAGYSGSLVKRTALCIAPYSVAFWYSGRLYILQVTVVIL
jgi:hypothetical protein